MARIIYAVQGDHNGHINRALSVAELLPGHEILFVGGGNALRAREAGYACEEMPFMHMQVKGNSIKVVPTFAGFIRNRLEQSGWLKRLRQIISAFDPDLVLTDCEYYTPRAALALGLPCYSLDHQHVLSRTLYSTGPGQSLSRYNALLFQRMFLPGLKGSLIVSFHRPPLKSPERDAIFGIVPRSDATELKASSEGHVLMYLPGCDLKKIERLFKGRKRQCRIYGHGALPSSGNLLFRAPSRSGFLEDIASADYVVCCGGHGTLTEALLLGKPCLCFPGRFVYEQYWNSFFVQQKGYGLFFPSMDIGGQALEPFEMKLEHYAQTIAKQDFDGRKALSARLEALLA